MMTDEERAEYIRRRKREAERLELLHRGIHEAGHYATAQKLRRMYPAYIRRVRIKEVGIVQNEMSGGFVGAKLTFPQGYRAAWIDADLSLTAKAPRVVHLMGGRPARPFTTTSTAFTRWRATGGHRARS